MEEGKHNTQRGGGTETDSMEMQENIQGEDNISSREEHRMGEAPVLCIPQNEGKRKKSAGQNPG